MQELTTTNTDIKSKIYTIRDKQVMLDRDLAELYGVEPKRLNEQVKRNIERFPENFRFQLNEDEKDELVANCDHLNTLKHSTSLPYVFTEQGVSMLSAVLRSKTAIEVSIKIIDSFVNMRKFIASNEFYLTQLKNIEKRQLAYEIKSDENFDKIFKALESSEQVQTQGIFFNGQIFDAHTFVSDLIRKATKSIIVIDNYIDDSTLTLLSKNQNVDITLYTHTVTKALKQDIEKYNKQYKQLDVKTNKNFHDRFLIIDEQEVYHIGASLKDLGKKVFGFSKIQDYTHLLQLL
jgi:flagellar capping protein FliD